MDFDLDDEDAPARTWDPEPHRREWYSEVRTGDEGWMVVRDGVKTIRLNRPNQVIEREYRESEWVRQEAAKLMTPADLGYICYQAHCALLLKMQSGKRPKPWMEMTAEERMVFVEVGPTGKLSRALFAAIREALKDQVG